ncbi:hypothetical protein HU200_050827 [Digitaria exilis]|uniref:Uncharacterized protein n=1 Tax=Digitaria exilis TaxID=1010633 RepID=A0A835EAW7_9POAL|nr:hypothetical protein HU200_050827 [Digitaria exilis]
MSRIGSKRVAPSGAFQFAGELTVADDHRTMDGTRNSQYAPVPISTAGNRVTCFVGTGDAETKRGCGSRQARTIMSKRPSLEPCCRLAAKRRRQFLYLVLDDWERGYSIHRVDLSDSAADVDDDEPPLVRMEVQHRISWSITAHGSKILAMQPSVGSPGIPAFDTETLAMSVCPWPESRGTFRKPLFASVGGRLFAMVTPCFDVLGSPPPLDSNIAADSSMPPFPSDCASCHALHPDGRTLFVSAKGWRSPLAYGDRDGTFSFDTERLEWTRHGDWLLPFRGQAYYDADLDGLVGFCSDKGEGAGYLCVCDVPLATAAGSCEHPPPPWKLGEDRLFRADSNRHRGARLLSMGNSCYCLVECLARRDEEHLRYPRHRVLRITTFRLKYDGHGRLRTTDLQAHPSKHYTHDAAVACGGVACVLSSRARAVSVARAAVCLLRWEPAPQPPPKDAGRPIQTHAVVRSCHVTWASAVNPGEGAFAPLPSRRSPPLLTPHLPRERKREARLHSFRLLSSLSSPSRGSLSPPPFLWSPVIALPPPAPAPPPPGADPASAPAPRPDRPPNRREQ